MNIVYIQRFMLVALIFWIFITICWNFYVHLTLFFTVLLIVKHLEKKYKQLLPISGKSVLITGCDTGFGYQLATQLADDGFTIFATVWKSDSKGANELKNRNLHNLVVLQMDVTSCVDIQRVANEVSSRTKEKGLWAIVNNAGFNIQGDLELCTLDQYRAVMEVNLYGIIAVTKAFLPQIRKFQGRIINISSVHGRYPTAMWSNYCISKYGVETMSDCLRLEMKKFGIDVSIIEPGRFSDATSVGSPEMVEKARRDCDIMWSEATEEVKTVYGKEYFYLPYESVKKFTSGSSSKSSKPVLDAIKDALLNTNPKPRYIVDGRSGFVDRSAMLARVYNFLPEYITDFYINSQTGCYREPSDQIN